MNPRLTVTPAAVLFDQPFHLTLSGLPPQQTVTLHASRDDWHSQATFTADAHGVIDLAAHAYLRRFDIEHTFRFIKNTLGWTTPSVCTPEQADRWTQMIAADYTQLRLAKPLVEDHRLPWEKPQPPDKLTPARTRRDFRRLRPALVNPARPPKSRTPGPGRPKGTRTGPRPRHPPIKRAA